MGILGCFLLGIIMNNTAIFWCKSFCGHRLIEVYMTNSVSLSLEGSREEAGSVGSLGIWHYTREHFYFPLKLFSPLLGQSKVTRCQMRFCCIKRQPCCHWLWLPWPHLTSHDIRFRLLWSIVWKRSKRHFPLLNCQPSSSPALLHPCFRKCCRSAQISARHFLTPLLSWERGLGVGS